MNPVSIVETRLKKIAASLIIGYESNKAIGSPTANVFKYLTVFIFIILNFQKKLKHSIKKIRS